MVFDWLAKFKYDVKTTKCKLFSDQVKFLGYTISAVGAGIV